MRDQWTDKIDFYFEHDGLNKVSCTESGNNMLELKGNNIYFVQDLSMSTSIVPPYLFIFRYHNLLCLPCGEPAEVVRVTVMPTWLWEGEGCCNWLHLIWIYFEGNAVIRTQQEVFYEFPIFLNQLHAKQSLNLTDNSNKSAFHITDFVK